MKKILKQILIYLQVFVFLGFILLPVYSVIIPALTPFERVGGRLIFPKTFHWENFVEVFKTLPMFYYLGNSFFYSLAISIFILVLAIGAAYSLSRYSYTGRKQFMLILMVTQMVPIIIVLIPVFLIFRSVGINNTRLSVVLTVAAIGLPFPIWLLKSYFDGIPYEMEEAAIIDGANNLQRITKLIIPLSAPGIFASLTITTILAWGQFLVPLVLLSDTSKMPITVGIFRLYGEHYVRWNIVMASVIIGIIPPLIIFFVFQKFIVSGLTSGAIK